MPRIRILLLILVGALVLGTATWLGLRAWRSGEPPLAISGFYLSEPRPLPEFTLTHHSGRPFTPGDLHGHWSFIYFGYTFCPDACPLTLTVLNEVQRKLAQQDADGDNAYLLISVDPKRDTPARLKEYTGFFNPRFQGATGDPRELDRLARQLGVVYMFPDGQEGDSYLVDHSATLLLINPRGELQAVFTPPQDPEALVRDFLLIRQRYQEYHG